jgi:4-hydroxybenzoate polyprenyltransferase
MEIGLLHLHNFLRWVILILLLVNIARHFANSQKPYTALDKKLGLFLMISAHITLLIGLYQTTLGRYGWAHVPEGTNVMKDTYWRFFLIEHPIGMLVAIILITIGKGVAKKAIPDTAKHKKAALLFTIALIIILAVIPWPFREFVGRPLMP